MARAARANIGLAAARRALKAAANPAKAAVHKSFFKDCDDAFLGVNTPSLRVVAKAHQDLAFPALRVLMGSTTHEERTLAHAILVLRFRAGDLAEQKRVFDFLLKHRRTIRTWDEVDDSAPYIIGPYLMDRSKTLLRRLVRSRNLWDRRIALVATLPMIRKGAVTETLALVEQVLDDAEDLIHKAAGWMLREVGKRDLAALKSFLKRHHARLPRTTLRYAIERFSKAERMVYLKGGF